MTRPDLPARSSALSPNPPPVARRIAVPAIVRDGAPLELRPQTSEDRALLRALLEGLSATSRYLRFLSPMPSIPARVVDLLADVDETTHVARLAVRDGRCIGEARFHRAGPDDPAAELAVTVADDHRRLGVATALCAVLAADAAALGIDRFTVVLSAANQASRALLRERGARLRFDGPVLTGTVPVDRFVVAAGHPRADVQGARQIDVSATEDGRRRDVDPRRHRGGPHHDHRLDRRSASR